MITWRWDIDPSITAAFHAGVNVSGIVVNALLRHRSRRIDFVTLTGESDFMAERADLIATIKTTFISPDETLSSSKGKRAAPWHVCTRWEIQDDILQDKRATMLHSSLSGPWLVLDQTRRPIDHVPRFTRLLTLPPHTRMYTIRWTSYNSGCSMKKQRRYPFAKHKLAPRSPNRRVCILRRSWSAFDDFASKLPRRNTDNSLSGKCFASNLEIATE